MSKECKKCKLTCEDCQKTEEDNMDENDVFCYCCNKESKHYGEHRYYQDEACNDFVPYPRWEQLFCKYVPYAYLAFLIFMFSLFFIFG